MHKLILPLVTFALGFALGAVLHLEPIFIVSLPQAKKLLPSLVIEQKEPVEYPSDCGRERIEDCTLTEAQYRDELRVRSWVGLSAYQQSLLDNSYLPSWKRTKDQSVLLARMFASEDDVAMRRVSGGGTCGELTDDHRLIARVVMNNSKSKKRFRGWRDVMRFLSPHVTLAKELSKDRQQWTSTLPETGDDQPTGWVPGIDGDWNAHKECWTKLRANTNIMWLKGPPFGDFRKDIKPKRWGNEGDVIRFFSKDDGKNRKIFCVIPYGLRNFFIAKDGRGCTVGDEATTAAYEGRRLE